MDERSKQLAAKLRPKVHHCCVGQMGGHARSRPFATMEDAQHATHLFVHVPDLEREAWPQPLMHAHMHKRLTVPRPLLQDVPLYEVLHKEADTIARKLQERRAEQAQLEARQCTFAPRLVAQPLAAEGRVMKARELQLPHGRDFASLLEPGGHV